MIKKSCFVVLMMVAFVMNAQEGGTASPYSFFGIGTQQFKGTTENRSMGGLSLFSDEYHFNLQNPASLARRRFTSFTISASHDEIRQQDNTATGRTSSTAIDYLAIGFPVTKKMGVSFGFMPYTAVGYAIDNSTDEFISRFEGKGGMNRVFLSAGYELIPGLSLGASGNYNFGNIQNEVIQATEGVEFGSRERNRIDLSGLTFDLGLQYEKPLSEKLLLTTALRYSPTSSIGTQNERVISSILTNNLGLLVDIDEQNIDVPDADFDFPSSFSVGAGLGNPNKWFAGAEYVTREESSFGGTRFNLENVTFGTATSLRLGGWYTPKYNSVTSYIQRATFRAGMRFDNTGLMINGEDINEFGISFGLGLPAGRYLSNANLGVEFGQRGTTDAGLVQENFVNFSLSFSFNDIWFLKTKFN